MSVPIRNFTREAACCLSGIKYLKWCHINTFQATNFQMLFGHWHQQTHLSFVRSRGTPLCCTCLRHCSGVCMRYRTVPLLPLTLKHKVVMSLLISFVFRSCNKPIISITSNYKFFRAEPSLLHKHTNETANELLT
jgi:hypothetical protein